VLRDCDRLECGPSAECEWREYYLRGVRVAWLECFERKMKSVI